MGTAVMFIVMFGLMFLGVPIAVAMFIAMIGIWLFRIPLAALSAYVFHAPLIFIWIVIAVDQLARFLMMHFYMKKKKVMQCVEVQAEQEALQNA